MRATSWDGFLTWWWSDAATGLSLDASAMGLDPAWVAEMEPALERAADEMDALEAGAIANKDEGRMVGHYWLRAPDRAPDEAIRRAIVQTRDDVLRFARDVHEGTIRSEGGETFRQVISIGIGGSALGPELVHRALGPREPALGMTFLDNTDPDGFDRVLASLGDDLDRTLVIVISKSGTTPETRNGALEVRRVMEARGLSFPRCAVAITGEDSALDRQARSEGWLARFPMWDWVGGRSSETSAVGLLPAALEGIDGAALLEGAKSMDAVTRRRGWRENPAALLALCWFHGTGGVGARDMVILPYKDRLQLLSRYLQQLVMESLGKEKDRQGKTVHQGIAVYGNKGSTDQHAFVQQLRDGVANFFVTFIRVLEDREGAEVFVEPDVTSGDYLHGFLLGTRQALQERGRPSITLTLPDVSARSLGALIALYERTVGLYASLIDVNAYHQPGVEAGKEAAKGALALQGRVLDALRGGGQAATAAELAEAAGSDDPVTVFLILQHLAANRPQVQAQGDPPGSVTYRWVD